MSREATYETPQPQVSSNPAASDSLASRSPDAAFWMAVLIWFVIPFTGEFQGAAMWLAAGLALGAAVNLVAAAWRQFSQRE